MTAESGQIERYRQRWHTSGSATPANSTSLRISATSRRSSSSIATQVVGVGLERLGVVEHLGGEVLERDAQAEPEALGERCEHPRLQPCLRVVGDAVGPHRPVL